MLQPRCNQSHWPCTLLEVTGWLPAEQAWDGPARQEISSKAKQLISRKVLLLQLLLTQSRSHITPSAGRDGS